MSGTGATGALSMSSSAGYISILKLVKFNLIFAMIRKPEQFTSEEEKKFKVANNLFRATVISALYSKYEDSYLPYTSNKELSDALDAKFGVSDTSTELYLMEQLFDYKMVDNHSVVEQAHEIQALTKELEQFLCVLPDKFMAGGIIAKLPHSWKDFTTSLKYKRQEFSVAKLIGSLDVEERTRAKDTREKRVESSATNMVQRKNNNTSRNKKKKNKQENNSKPKQTTTFKKKKNNKDGGCFVYGGDEHWASSCPDYKFKKEKKSANMVVSEAE
ncbi:uncharacterized protein [Miscanthus floridulus]|uniref:uncharacterized protein n=1 Tax=Miscanthus floridulus TaxID=154761 RepID=UPI00345B2AB9